MRLLALVAALLCASAQAQPFPAGPINLVVPVAPGDAGDLAARAIGEELSRRLGVPVLVVNRPGSGGAVGTASAAQAKKDGQTLLFTQNAALTFRAVLDPQSVSYDALRDFVPLGSAVRTPSVIAVRADGPARSLAELIEQAKKNPGSVRVGHTGAGSVGDFCLQLVNALTGAGLVGVPHAGAAPAVTALRGGHIEGVVLAMGALAGQVKAGAFRGVVGSSRIPEFGDIPTLRDLGFAEDLFGIWFGFFAPAGTPDEATRVLVPAIEQAVKAQAIAARLAPAGILVSYGSPEQTTAEIRDELQRVSAMAKKAGLVK